MDNKALLHTLANALGRDPKDVASLMDGLTAIIRERLSDMDAIAIPGFGQFEAVKEDERIAEDPSTGKQMLYPPSIKVTFTPSARLKRKLEVI